MPIGMANKLEGIPPQVEEWHKKEPSTDPGKLEEYNRFIKEREAVEAEARQRFERSLSESERELRARSPLFFVSAGYRPGVVKDWKQKQRVEFQKSVKVWRREEERKFLAYLETDYRPPPVPSLAERLVDFFTGWARQEQQEMFTSRSKPPLTFAFQQQVAAPKEVGLFVAGAVGSGESLVYSVGRLAGFETPSIPPSVVGAGVKAVVSQVTEGKADVSMFARMSPSYAAGSLFGEFLIGKGVGKVASKTFSIAKKAVPSTVKFKTGGWLLEHSSWYKSRVAKRLAPQIVGVEQYGKHSVLSLGKAKASELAFDLALTPKSSMVSISRVPEVAVKGRVMPHFFFRGGQASVGFLRELSFEKPTLGGLFSQESIITQVVEKPALSKLPFVPSLLREGGRSVSPFVVAPHGWFEEEQQKRFSVVVPKFKVEQPQRLNVFQVSKPMQPSVVEEMPLAKVWQKAEAKAVQKSKVAVVQVQRQRLIFESAGKSAFEFPTRSAQKRPESPFEFPKPKHRRRGKRDRGFGWRFRVHGVSEPEQVMGMNLQKEFRGWKM